MKALFSFLIFQSFCFYNYAQITPSIEWQKCFGGSGPDYASSVAETYEGGVIVAGFSESQDGDVSGNHGFQDYWIVKLDSMGNLQWQKSLGGSNDEQANSIRQTSDGGYIVAGFSSSNDQDVSGNHGGADYWIVKLDSDGSLDWQKCFGGSDDDIATYIQQTSDGGFIVAGNAVSQDGDVTGNHGFSDYWILKLDLNGDLEWQKALGGSNSEFAYCIEETIDGGFVVCGGSNSNNGDISGNHGGYDGWVAKIDEEGNLAWQKSLGGSSDENCGSIKAIGSGGFIIGGGSGSTDGDVSQNLGGSDYWLVRLDADGNLIGDQSYGGTNDEGALSIQESLDGGFVMGGFTYSADGNVTGYHGGSDCWIVKVDSVGNLIWQKSLGGGNVEQFGSIQTMQNNEYVVVGSSLSNDGDVFGNHGDMDCWVVKLTTNSATGVVVLQDIYVALTPNPVQQLLTVDFINQITNPIITVFDLQGRSISLPFTILNNKAEVNTENLPNGFYTFQVIDKYSGKTAVAKFVKE